MKRGVFSAGALFLVLVGLLGALAVGWGLWSKTLKVEGTVNTGDFNAQWTKVSTNDPSGEPSPDPCTEANPNDCDYEHKDVGSCDAWVDEEDDQLLHVQIENAYPSYECTITASVLNSGTIPFNILVDGAAADPELDIECDPPAGQVDPGETAEGTCWVHVKQEAKERSTYTAEATLCVAQWNEDPSVEECLAAAGNSEPEP